MDQGPRFGAALFSSGPERRETPQPPPRAHALGERSIGSRIDGSDALRDVVARAVDDLRHRVEAHPFRRVGPEQRYQGQRVLDRRIEPGLARLAVEDPSTAVAGVLELLHPADRPAPGVHPTAVVEEGVTIDESAHVGPYAVVGTGSVVGPRSAVLAHAVVGRGCRLGEGVTLHPHVVLYDRTEIGDRVTVHAGTVLGADGFGYASAGGVHRKVPQVGRTVIEDDVEIGALSAVDRAALEETRIGAGTKIDNLVQVGHNVTTGRGCILCGQVGIAGSATLGDYVVLGGQVGVVGHVPISSRVQVGGKSMAAKPYEAGQVVAGIPAIDIKESHRQKLRLARLGDVMQRLRDLEKRVEALGTTETNEETSD